MFKKLGFIFQLLLWTRVVAAQQLDVKREFAFAAQQYQRLLATHPDTTKFPQSTNPDGSPRDMPSSWWRSGFFGGSLWYLFEQTKDPQWKMAAERWTRAVAGEQFNTSTHDLGFMLYCPLGNGLRLTNNKAYVPVLAQGAKSLATRFDSEVGLIKSWDTFKGRNDGRTYTYPVIIDNMMNLEMLLWASKATGEPSFRRLAITHADNTIKHHFRADFSTYHVVCYGPKGEVLARKTHQGYADESAWSRGQAWGLYGYTVMYRETKDPKYLVQAKHIADFYLRHPNLPADKIPYWDFDAPNLPRAERDASAAAVAASGLLELSQYSKTDQKRYFKAAEQMLVTLASPAYKAKLGENNNFLLMHSVGSKPANSEVNVPLVYADYYYLEALVRYQTLALSKQTK